MLTEPRSLNTIRWSRFALQTKLLLLVVAGLAALLWMLGALVLPLRAEVQRLREKAGYLSVEEEDRNRIHLLAIPEDLDNTWRWKVYLPPGKRYRFVTKWDDIPAEGVPDYRSTNSYSARSLTLRSKQSRVVTVLMRIRKRPSDQRWVQKINVIYGSGASRIFAATMPESLHEWLENPAVESQREFGKQQVSESVHSMVLLRERTPEETPDGLAPGIMFWIEETGRSVTVPKTQPKQ